MRFRSARGFYGVAGVTLAALTVLVVVRGIGRTPPLSSSDFDNRPRLPAPVVKHVDDVSEDGQDDEHASPFRVPSGEPTSLSCADARRVVAQVQGGLAYEHDPVQARALADGIADWLDPHGLWTLASDAPTAASIERAAPELLAELEGRKSTDCRAARTVGLALAAWTAELRAIFERARAEDGGEDLAAAAADPMFRATPLRGPAKELAARIGHRVGAFERGIGPSGAAYVKAARDRFFPPFDDEGWARVVVGAAVRAYVPLVDPHGAWAPFDEEASIYEVELSARPPSRLWESGEVTAVGFRVTQGVAAPLAVDDVVLSLAGVPTAGLPLEQLEQLGYASADAQVTTRAVVFRAAERSLRIIELLPIDDGHGPAPEREGLSHVRVPYADGDALVVTIRDVRDDLGDQLARTIRNAAPITGVVLDLRGNGGGSTDGAIDALGLFLPGVALFPMKRRDGTVETDRSPEPARSDRWTGPVATLVDGSTASAAEMIAGAISVYRRGPSVGTLTYGKGCAQEYIDDDAHVGVLRMTTLLYALPDGTPVQRVGLTPTIRLPFAPPSPGAAAGAAGGARASDSDREATLVHAPPTWRGPDMRSAAFSKEAIAAFAWPSHAGNVGPCKDEDVCRAIRALGNGGTKRISAVPQKTR